MTRRLLQTVRAIVDLLNEAYHEWRNDRVIRLGAGLAYYSLFGIVPFLSILIAVAGLIFSQDEVQALVIERLGGLVEGDVEGLASALTAQIEGSTANLGLIGAATLLFAASVVFVALQDVLNLIWHAPFQFGIENTLRKRIVAFSVVLLSAAVLMASLLIQRLIGWAQRALPGDTPILESLTPLLTTLISWVVGICAIAVVFRFLPNVNVRWLHAFIGGAVTALLATAGSALFGLYFSRFGTASLSGAAGSLVMFLLWIFYQVQILLAAAELTRMLGLRSARAGSA